MLLIHGHYIAVLLSFLKIRFLSLRSYPLCGNAYFPIATLLLISLLDLASVVIIFLIQQNLFILLYYFFSFGVYILTAVSFPLLIFKIFLFLPNIFIQCFFRLYSVYGVCRPSADLWLIVIIAWPSTHLQTSMH